MFGSICHSEVANYSKNSPRVINKKIEYIENEIYFLPPKPSRKTVQKNDLPVHFKETTEIHSGSTV